MRKNYHVCLIVVKMIKWFMVKKIRRLVSWSSMTKEVGNKVWYGIKNFHANHGNLIAASSTFYAILSSLPIMIAIIASVGLIIDDFNKAQTEVLNYLKLFFPNLSPWVMATIKNVIVEQIGRRGFMNILNWVILLWASMGFISSIFNGIHVLSGVKFHRRWKIPFKSFVVLIVTILTCFMVIFLDSYWVMAMILLIYFTFILYFLLEKGIELKDAILGAIIFLLLFFASKFLFGFYLKNIRGTLIRNFGDFYTLVVAVLWMYYIMNSFFLSASISLVRPKKN